MLPNIGIIQPVIDQIIEIFLEELVRLAQDLIHIIQQLARTNPFFQRKLLDFGVENRANGLGRQRTNVLKCQPFRKIIQGREHEAIPIGQQILIRVLIDFGRNQILLF